MATLQIDSVNTAATVSGVTDYIVTRTGQDASGITSESHTVAAGSTSFVFSNLLPGTAYTFSVQAQNTYGNGPAGSASIAAAAPPGLPLASTLIDTFSGSSIDPTKWSYETGGVVESGGVLTLNGDPSNTAGTYLRSIPVDFTGAVMPVDLVSVTDTGTTEYWLQASVSVGQTPVSFIKFSISNGVITVLLNDPVTPGGSVAIGFNPTAMKTLRFRHVVSQGVVFCEYSADKQTWTAIGAFFAPIWLTNVQMVLLVFVPAGTPVVTGATTTAPSVPTSVVRSTTGSSATISWAPPINNGGAPITSYTVSRDGVDINGFGTYTTTISASSSALTAEFDNLAAGTTYNLAVQAVNAVGAGPVSVASITTAGTPVTPPTGGGTSGSGSYDDFTRTAPMGPAVPAGKTSWGLRFADDFVGSALSAHWKSVTPDGTIGWGSEYFDSSMVTVSGSKVTLSMTQTGKSSSPSGGRYRYQKAGMITTVTKDTNQIAMKPGDYLEAYILTPPSTDGNMWPSFWGIGVANPGSNNGNGSGVGWPPEIDFFEFGYSSSYGTYLSDNSGAPSIGNTGGLPKLSTHFIDPSTGSRDDGGAGTYGTGDLRGVWSNFGILWKASDNTLHAYVNGVDTGKSCAVPSSGTKDSRGDEQILPQGIIFSHQAQTSAIAVPTSFYSMDWLRLWTPQ